MIYFLQDETGPIKAGKSKNMVQRIRDIQTCNPRPIKLLGRTGGYTWTERQIHKKFAHLRIHGEWFRPEKELLNFIKKVCEI